MAIIRVVSSAIYVECMFAYTDMYLPSGGGQSMADRDERGQDNEKKRNTKPDRVVGMK